MPCLIELMVFIPSWIMIMDIILSVLMLSVIMPSLIMLSDIILSVIIKSVCVILLNVMALLKDGNLFIFLLETFSSFRFWKLWMKNVLIQFDFFLQKCHVGDFIFNYLIIHPTI